MTNNKNNSLLPVYAAIGDDALKRETVTKRLRSRLQKMGDISFNFDEFDGDQARGGDIVASCNTMPFASPVRMVVVKAAEKLKKADSEPLVAYLQNPSPTTVLLIEAEKLAKSTRLYKAVARYGPSAVIECLAPKKGELPRLVRSMAVSHGITLTDGAARLLVDLAGEDTVRLDAELSKIAVAHTGNDAVNEHEVSSLVARTTEVKVWDFLDALSSRNAKRCLACLPRMKSNSPHSLMALSTGRVRELICAKSMVRRGQPRAIAKALKKQDWQVRYHAEWAGRFTEAELRQGLISARDTEQAMKSGCDPEPAYLEWLLKFLNGSR